MTKKCFFGLLCLVGITNFAEAQSVTINIDAGALRNATGTAVEPTGGLLQLIASPSGTFSAPTSSSYVSGDNVLVTNFAMNQVGGTGEVSFTLNSLPLTAAGYTLTTGEALLLRFYPSLTLAAAPAAPTLATTFGQVRSSTVEFGGTIDPNETAWVVPAAGANVDFNYVTVSNGGTAAYTNASAFATGVVGAAVPEPSSVMLLGSAVAALLGFAKLRRRS